MECWVLIIDDDPGTREALVAILRRHGYLVSSLDGVAGLEVACRDRRFQAAVVDYHLPDLNGVEVAARLKLLQPDCKVVLISSELPSLAGLPQPAEVVDRFLAKPFSKDAILEVISQLCPLGSD